LFSLLSCGVGPVSWEEFVDRAWEGASEEFDRALAEMAAVRKDCPPMVGR
jgi:hypothetical protein